MRPHTFLLVPIKDNEVIIPITKFIPTSEVLEGIVKHIIPLYTHLMFKVNSIVNIHPTSNVTKLDELQIKTVPRLELHVLRIGKCVITDYVDFSLTKKNKDLYEYKFRVYSNRLIIKHKLLIKDVYEHLIVEELKQLKLTIEKSNASDLMFSRRVQNVRKYIIEKRILFNVVLLTIGFTTILKVILLF